MRKRETLLFCESEARDAQGTLLSKAMATMKYMPFAPAPAKT